MYLQYLYEKILQHIITPPYATSLEKFNLKVLKDDTTEGIIYKSENPNCVIKGTKQEGLRGNRKILYEYFITEYGIKTLYSKDFFCSTLGYINTENRKEPKYYVMYEYINGYSFKELIIKKNTKHIYQILAVLCMILHNAFEEIEFVHYDLHTENIMIENERYNKDINFLIDGYEYNMTTSFGIKIIDYGFSHFTYNNTHYGMNPFEHLKITEYEANDNFDLFKLLFSICYTIDDKNFINHVANFYRIPIEMMYKYIEENHKNFHCPVGINIDNRNPSNFLNYLYENNLVETLIRKKSTDDICSYKRKKETNIIYKQDEIRNFKSFMINNYIIETINYFLDKKDNLEMRQTLELLKKKTGEDYKENDRQMFIKFVDNFPNILCLTYDIENCKDFNMIRRYKEIIEKLKNYTWLRLYDNNLYLKISYLIKLYDRREREILYHFINKLLNKKIDNKKELDLLYNTLSFFEEPLLKMEQNFYYKQSFVPCRSKMQIYKLFYSEYRNMLFKLFYKSFNVNPYEYLKMCFKKNMNDSDILMDLRKYVLTSNTQEQRGEWRTKHLEFFLNAEKGRVNKDYKYLDIGASDGEITYAIGNFLNLSKEQVIGADVGDWKDVSSKGINKNISYNIIPKSGRLPFESSSFDMISAFMCLHHIEDVVPRLLEIFRILKPGGRFVIREHDCDNEYHKMIHDLEHAIYDVSKAEKPNLNFFYTYRAYYISRDMWKTILTDYGFKFFTDNGATPNTPTRGYYEVYTKPEELFVIEKLNEMWLTGNLTDNFPRCPYFHDNKALPIGIKYSNLKFNEYPKTHWGQRKLLLSEIDLLNRIDKNTNWLVVYAGAAEGRHIRILVDMFPNTTFHLYDPNKFSTILEGVSNIKFNIYNKEGFFTDDVAHIYKSMENIIFISDIRTNTDETGFKEDQEMQKRWVEIINPVWCMLKYKMPYPIYDKEKDKYQYLNGLVRLQCWAPSLSAETRLISSRPYSYKTWDTYEYEQNLSWYNMVLRNTDFSDYNLKELGIDGNLRSVWSKHVDLDVLGFDFLYEIKILCDYLNKHRSVCKENLSYLLNEINKLLMTKGDFVNYLRGDTKW